MAGGSCSFLPPISSPPQAVGTTQRAIIRSRAGAWPEQGSCARHVLLIAWLSAIATWALSAIVRWDVGSGQRGDYHGVVEKSPHLTGRGPPRGRTQPAVTRKNHEAGRQEYLAKCFVQTKKEVATPRPRDVRIDWQSTDLEVRRASVPISRNYELIKH